MVTGPRGRLIASTIATVQELGVSAAGLNELLKRGNASRNSLYQHFPEGKSELIQISARIVARLVDTHIIKMSAALLTVESTEQWLDELFEFWREPLESSDYRAGSFMMAAALDQLNPDVQAIAAHTFTEWSALLAQGLTAAGAEPPTAHALASLLLTVIEGAIVHSRALKSSKPFDDARSQVEVLLKNALD